MHSYEDRIRAVELYYRYGKKASVVVMELGYLKWFTEFGHLNRGDMLTSEQHRCHNEKEISAQSLNANPLNWSLTRTTPWQMQPALWMSAFPQ